MKGLLNNSSFIFCCSLALFLNASCRPLNPPDHGLKDRFSERRAKTLYDKNRFVIKISVEAPVSEVKDSSSSPSDQSNESNTANESNTEIKQVDWIEAPLTGDYLKKLGAVRIKTVSQGEKVKTSISQAGTFIDSQSDVSFINQYYRLDYELLDFPQLDETDLKEVKKSEPQKLWAWLFGKVDRFYGFPDTVYYILPRLEGNYLIFYRLGKPETIPYDQVPVARRVGEFLATPLVGYPVSYCIPAKEKDDYGHITDLVVPKCEGIAAETAQYVDFSIMNKKLFQYKSKLDIFPRDFFDGEWIYYRTLIEASEKSGLVVGHQPFEPAHLVEFTKEEEQFQVKDSTKYQELREKDRLPSLFIPVKWKEYEMDWDDGTLKSFREVENRDTKNVERSYFSLDFKRLAKIEKVNFSGHFTVHRVLISDDSFHFDVHIERENSTPIVVKYSFKRVVDNPDYLQKRWHEEDSTSFHPVFNVERKYYPKTTDITKEDRDKFLRITRFDPNQKEIRWYFSTQTPKDEWVRYFGRLAIELENKTFQEAGKYSDRKIRVVLDESEDKELGDVRYNILNILATQERGTNILGYGPNVSNPITGEIVSATANIWISNIVDIYIKAIKNYIRFHIWPLPWKLLPSSPGVSDFFHEKIQKLCPEVAQFISQYKGIPLHPIYSADDLDQTKDKEIRIQCARKMARSRILRTIIHEIRHGLGFRHVFSASADRENYYRNYDEMGEIFGAPVWLDGTPVFQEEVTAGSKEPSYYSSVMDYGTIYYPILSVSGKYDISATRYLYFDQLEVNDLQQTEVELDPGETVVAENEIKGLITLSSADKSILQEITDKPVPFINLNSGKSSIKKIKQSQLKRYHVCGGAADRDDDPFCIPFDYGRTPKEIVQNTIHHMKNNMMTLFNRYDSERTVKIEQIGYFASTIINPFLSEWSKLRGALFANKGKKLSNYYSDNERKIKEYREIIDSKRQEDPSFNQFYEVVPVLADFFKELFHLPIKSCVYRKVDGSYEMISLEVILTQIKSSYSENSREVFVNCESDAVKKWAAEENVGEFITEVGMWKENREYFIHPKAEDPYDEISALQSVGKFQKNLGISLLFEPDIMMDVFEGVKDRVLNGIDINPYVDRTALKQKMGLPEDAALPEFPLFLDYETHFILDGVKFSNLIFMQTLLESILEIGTPEHIKTNLLSRYHAVVEESSGFLEGILLIQNQGYSMYERKHPFVHKAYRKYLELYDTEEKQNQVSWLEYFEGLPSVVYLKRSRKLAVPFDENNMFEDIFKRYNEYKVCIEKSSPCEQELRKKAFMELVESSVEVWLLARHYYKQYKKKASQ